MKVLKKKFGSARQRYARPIVPTRTIIQAFVGIILLGAILLMLPVASKSGQWTSPLTAFFTATSATCVTGLVVVDTNNYWTGFGHVVILLLIQIGGLGFMTLTTLFSFFLRRRITLRERMVMTASLNIYEMSGIVRLTKKILIGTFIFEGLGALVLSFRFIGDYGVVSGIKRGIFLSISAFCNAGFDLMGKYGDFSSLTRYSGDVVVNITIMILIVLGGLGFFVWGDLMGRDLKKRRSVHTKIVLIMTACLIVSGAIFIFMYERNNPATLGNMPIGEKILASFFQSITCRTAGFNTIDQNMLSGAGKAISMILMFIGGSPGSTAGGIKTVTVGILLLTAVSVCKGNQNVIVFKKTITVRSILNAVTILIGGAASVFVGTFVVYSAESITFTEALFEVISAFATVGLTTGITSGLSSISLITLMVLMYFGRVGILTFSVGILMGHVKIPKLYYPEENVMIG